MTINAEIFQLEPNVMMIWPPDRSPTGEYQIESGMVHVHPFTINPGGSLRIPLVQCKFRQDFSIRAWISVTPYGNELYNNFRWHPNTSGISHIFYDKSLDPTPTPEQSAPMRNSFSQIIFQPGDNMIPVDPGVYYYNVQNLENQKHCYTIGFTGVESDPDYGPCGIPVNYSPCPN